MDTQKFRVLVEEALATIPTRFLVLLDNVVVVVEDEARAEQGVEVGIRKNQRLLGLYQGVPQTQRGPNYSLVLPDKITIFKTPIEAIGQTPEGIRELVRETIWHEVAHHFGSNETRVQNAERRRQSKHPRNS